MQLKHDQAVRSKSEFILGLAQLGRRFRERQMIEKTIRNLKVKNQKIRGLPRKTGTIGKEEREVMKNAEARLTLPGLEHLLLTRRVSKLFTELR